MITSVSPNRHFIGVDKPDVVVGLPAPGLDLAAFARGRRARLQGRQPRRPLQDHPRQRRQALRLRRLSGPGCQMAALSAQLPEAVRTTLSEFTAAAQEAFAEDLLSVVLFGSAAEGRLRATSDVNVVLVLRRVDPKKIETIGEAYRFAHAAIRLSAMFILEGEIGVAKDAFAVKFADIIARHQVLYGPDPFVGLTVSREAALHRLLQVLVNLQLRLRERYALFSGFDEQLARAAADAIGPLRASAAVLLWLESGAGIEPRDALRQIADETGSSAALAAMIDARESGSIPEIGAAATLVGAIELATRLAERAEQLV